MTAGQEGDRPVWRTIADVLRASILDGTYPPGARLPSENALGLRFGVTRKTVRLAYDLLRAEGRVTSVKARGYFVREQAILRRLVYDLTVRSDQRGWYAALARQGLRSRVEAVVSWSPAPARVAEGLEVEPGTVVLVRSRVMAVEGEPPTQLATSYIPRAVAERAPQVAEQDTGPGGILSRFEDAGYGPLHFDEVVTGRYPDPGETDALELLPGVPVLVVHRTTWSAEGDALDWMERIIAADRAELAYRFGEQP